MRSHSRPNIATIIAFALVVIGAINWGLVGALNLDLVAALLGEGTIASRVVYVLVGLSGLYMLFARPGMRATDAPPVGGVRTGR